jgi:hypothetical protein
MSEARTLAEIRGLVGRIDPEWQLAADPDGMMVESTLGGERIPIIRFTSFASSDEMQLAADAPRHLRFLLGLLDRAIEKVRQTAGGLGCDGSPPDRSGAPAQGQSRSDDAARERNYAAEAAMKCGEPAFKKFLIERHGLESPATNDRTAQKLRSLLGITTRAALNDDMAAAERWKRLRGEFENWKRAG